MNAPAKINTSDAEFRASVVGASEVAALFDCSPWLTHFELWHRKNGTIDTPEFNAINPDGRPENERAYWGVKLEPMILQAACDRWGYEPLETPHQLHNGDGLGGHPDQMVRCPERGSAGPLECKMVDWLVVKKWGDEPPLSYLLQSLTYQGLTRSLWGDMIVLVGGNELRRFQYDFRPMVYADIERRVAAFWASVRAGKPPKPDYTRDGQTIIDTIGAPDESMIDLRRNNRAGILAATVLEAKARAKEAEAEADTAKAELLEIIGASGSALLEGYRVGCGMTKGSPDKLITAAMVGETIKGRKGYRQFNIKEMQ